MALSGGAPLGAPPPLPRLLVVLDLGVLDACILGVAGHAIAALLRSLVIGLHLVVASVSMGFHRLLMRLGIRGCLNVGRLGVLHADIAVIALARRARFFCGSV